MNLLEEMWFPVYKNATVRDSLGLKRRKLLRQYSGPLNQLISISGAFPQYDRYMISINHYLLIKTSLNWYYYGNFEVSLDFSHKIADFNNLQQI